MGKTVVHNVRIPCNCLPLVGEADYGRALRTMIHCDRTAPFHVMIYLLKGGMEIVEDGVCHKLTPGTLFFLKSGVHHWGEKPFLNGSAWYYVHFFAKEPAEDAAPYRPILHPEQRVVLQGRENEGCLVLPKMLKLPAQNSIRQKTERLIESHNSGDMIGSSLFLWEIFKDCAAGEQNEGKGVGRTEQMLTYLKAHYAEDVSAKELEELTGLSYKYAATLFKEQTGMTVSEYRMMLRIRRAETLLCATEMSVGEIAAQTGFYDAFYFSRIFKRERGVSPSVFRRTYVPGI